MSLTTDEVLRAKSECGYNVVGIGAEAYGLDGYVALFDRAIQPYLFDLGTTSATIVTAATTPTDIAITLAANPTAVGNTTQPLAFVQGSNVVVDVGSYAENSVIRSLIGLVATVTLSLAHGAAGAYPVKLKGAEQPIRDAIARIDAINGQLAGSAVQTAGVKKVDEIELYASEKGRRSSSTKDRFGSLIAQRLQARRDLCLLLGIPYLPDYRQQGSGGGAYEAY